MIQVAYYKIFIFLLAGVFWKIIDKLEQKSFFGENRTC